MLILAATAAITYSKHDTDCICKTSCRITGCAGCCIGLEKSFTHVWNKACCGIGACTEGCKVVISAVPLHEQRPERPSLMGSKGKKERRYCKVYESDKKRMVKTFSKVKKDVMTEKIIMVPVTRKVMKTVMRQHKQTKYVEQMVK